LVGVFSQGKEVLCILVPPVNFDLKPQLGEAKRKGKAAAPARQKMTDAIAEVLKAYFRPQRLPRTSRRRGREIGKRAISYALQALKKSGRVRIRGGKWMLPKAGAKPAPGK
jgi:hypothetical protein